MEFFHINIFILLDKVCKYIKLLQIQGTGCYNINVVFISSPKNGFLELVRFEFRHVSIFSCIYKKDCKVFDKNAVKLLHNITYRTNLFALHYI